MNNTEACSLWKAPCITIPTYNERENIVPLLEAILELDPSYQIIVIDDDSPDQTHALVKSISEREPRVSLIHRVHERGRGTAGIAGFLMALHLGADAIVEMDADFSHAPRDIPRLLDLLHHCDLAIGSRAVAGGGERGRPLSRQYITRLASSFIQHYLRLPVHDPTSGFRAFRAEVLRTIPLGELKATGPEIVEEILFLTHRLGFSIRELGIQFQERAAGQSTLNFRILRRTFTFVFLLPFFSRKVLRNFR